MKKNFQFSRYLLATKRIFTEIHQYFVAYKKAYSLQNVEKQTIGVTDQYQDTAWYMETTETSNRQQILYSFCIQVRVDRWGI